MPLPRILIAGLQSFFLLLLHKLNGGFTEAVLARPKCEAFCAVSDGGLTEMVRVISPVWILTMFSFVVVIVLVVVLVFLLCEILALLRRSEDLLFLWTLSGVVINTSSEKR